MVHSVYISFAESGVLEGYCFFFFLLVLLFERGSFHYMMSDWLFFDALIEPTSISNDIQQQTAIGRNAFHYEYIYA